MKKKEKLSFNLKVLGLYFLLALVVTFPLALHLKGYALGDLKSDIWKHIWGFWWIKDNLVSQQIFPISTRLLNFPAGGSLFFIDPPGGGAFHSPAAALWSGPGL